jgi:UDP-N-acetylmuramyl pentapeptide phosphotransferase/UDP-N-acetylglucosamine-1-phosphate transferase
MGDTGSNTLGIILGLFMATSKYLLFKIMLLLFLIVVQLYAEFSSITRLIENSNLLNYLDMLGRDKNASNKNKKGNC